MKKYLEMEAELGSDDEEHDGCEAKRINASDAEENEQGLDKDLEGFIVNEKPPEGSDEEAMRDKYIEDIQRDDKAQTNQVISSIFMGNNRKARRGDVDLGDFGERRRNQDRLNNLVDGDSSDSAGFLAKPLAVQIQSDEEIS